MAFTQIRAAGRGSLPLPLAAVFVLFSTALDAGAAGRCGGHCGPTASAHGANDHNDHGGNSTTRKKPSTSKVEVSGKGASKGSHRHAISHSPNVPDNGDGKSTGKGNALSHRPNVPDGNSSSPTNNKHIAITHSPNVPDGKGSSNSGKTGERGDDSGAKGTADRAPTRSPATDDDASAGSGNRKTSNHAGDSGKTTTRQSAASAPSAALAAGKSISMTHNSSRMSLASSGNTLTIVYDKPRDGLAGLGIKPGTPLFKGTRDGDKLSGEATTFTRHCGTRTYPVSGSLTNDGHRVELHGEKPVLGGSCGVAGTTSETLVFDTGG